MEEEIIKNLKNSIATDGKELNFENKNDFNFILININNLESFKWSEPNYLDNILGLDIYSTNNTNPEIFLNNVIDALDVNTHNENSDAMIETQLIAEFPEYIFEMVYINNVKKEDKYKNDLASLLIRNGETIYGNAIIFKTSLPIDNENNLFVDINKIDIKFILENRIKTKVVIYDGEWKEIEVIGNLEDYAKEFFDDVHLKFESPFLKHNINIWYEKLDGVNSYVCGKILNKPIYKCIWFTMISDEYRGSLSLNEVNTIIKLSNHLIFPYEPPSEWLIDEKDVYGRDKIKNKYRILEKARKKYLN
jgi:hypothetical protein